MAEGAERVKGRKNASPERGKRRLENSRVPLGIGQVAEGDFFGVDFLW